MPTPETVLGNIALYIGSAPMLSSWSEIRKHLHDRSPDGRVIRTRDEIMSELWSQLWSQLRVNAAATRDLGAEVAERFQNHEAMGVLVNFCEDAYREPLDERRRMLGHAAAGLTDASLSVAEYARLWRIVGEIEPRDIDTLYALWLFPDRAFPGATRGAAEMRLQELFQRGGDALEACNAVAIRVMAGAGSAGTQYLEITATGRLLLQGLRTFLLTRPRPDNIAGHVVGGMRIEADARAVLASSPAAAGLAGRYYNHLFDHWSVQFDGIGLEAAPTSKARIIIRSMACTDADALRAELPTVESRMGAPVDQISFDSCQPVHGQPDRREVQIGGPFDVLCWLAYDLNAFWA